MHAQGRPKIVSRAGNPVVTVMLVLKEKSNPTLYRYSTFSILGTVSVFKSRVGICKVFALKG